MAIDSRDLQVENLRRAGRTERIVTIILVFGPPLGVIWAALRLFHRPPSILDGILGLTLYILSGMGITVGFHRYFTHQSFRATPGLRKFLAIAGSMALQGGIIGWVADHRRHHAFADQPGDPHSPHVDAEGGVPGVIRGFIHAHTGWLFSDPGSDPERWCPDMVKDPAIRKIHNAFPLLTLASLAGPALIGGLLTMSLDGAISAFLWGAVVRAFLLHHVTWSINSVCHLWGRRPYESKDESVNNRWLAIISFGESWHNTHHAFPTSSRHGIDRGQIDPSAAAIRMFERFGWASDPKLPDPKTLEAKRVS